MRRRKVLVTGASGFIGGRVVERLALREPNDVRALIHRWSRAARVARFPIDIAVGDIMNVQETSAAMEGVTHVVHCAFTDAPEVIIEGTRNLLQSALQAGVERFVYVSTAEVYGRDVSGTVVETASTQPTGRVYGDSKAAAEELCREYQGLGLSTAVMRPSVVYGPYSGWWTVRMAKRLQSGDWCEFEEYGNGFCNLVYVDDLVSALLLAAEHEAADGEVFNVNGASLVTWNEYFCQFNAALGLPPLAKKSRARSAIRTGVMNVAEKAAFSVVRQFDDRLMEIYLRGGLASKVMKRIKKLIDSAPSPRELTDSFHRKAIYSDRKLRERLGYVPRYDLEKGLHRCAVWLARCGYLTRPELVSVGSIEFAKRPASTNDSTSQPVSASQA